mmetsp:Transcript_6967/g.17440  ORF Transcript_6967/g.17440 Transcript_6967/m.17440 type:complete len:367 (-) Transcript_6967:66-1166(-)
MASALQAPSGDWRVRRARLRGGHDLDGRRLARRVRLGVGHALVRRALTREDGRTQRIPGGGINGRAVDVDASELTSAMRELVPAPAVDLVVNGQSTRHVPATRQDASGNERGAVDLLHFERPVHPAQPDPARVCVRTRARAHAAASGPGSVAGVLSPAENLAAVLDDAHVGLARLDCLHARHHLKRREEVGRKLVSPVRDACTMLMVVRPGIPEGEVNVGALLDLLVSASRVFFPWLTVSIASIDEILVHGLPRCADAVAWVDALDCSGSRADRLVSSPPRVPAVAPCVQLAIVKEGKPVIGGVCDCGETVPVGLVGWGRDLDRLRRAAMDGKMLGEERAFAIGSGAHHRVALRLGNRKAEGLLTC